MAFGYIVKAAGSWDAPLVPMTVTAALAAVAWLRIDATKPLGEEPPRTAGSGTPG